MSWALENFLLSWASWAGKKICWAELEALPKKLSWAESPFEKPELSWAQLAQLSKFATLPTTRFVNSKNFRWAELSWAWPMKNFVSSARSAQLTLLSWCNISDVFYDKNDQLYKNFNLKFFIKFWLKGGLKEVKKDVLMKLLKVWLGQRLASSISYLSWPSWAGPFLKNAERSWTVQSWSDRLDLKNPELSLSAQLATLEGKAQCPKTWRMRSNFSDKFSDFLGYFGCSFDSIHKNGGRVTILVRYSRTAINFNTW